MDNSPTRKYWYVVYNHQSKSGMAVTFGVAATTVVTLGASSDFPIKGVTEWLKAGHTPDTGVVILSWTPISKDQHDEFSPAPVAPTPT